MAMGRIAEMGSNMRKKSLMKALLLMLATLVCLASCKDCTSFPPSDVPPDVTLTIDATSVTKGDAVHINGTARSLKQRRDAAAYVNGL